MTYVLDVASGVAQVVSSARRRLGRPRWSPDGGHLTRSTAGFCEDDEQCFESVAIESADHEEFSSFSSDSLRYLSPDWLPSGNGVAFVREGTYLLDIATRALDDLEDTPVSGNLAGRLSNVSDLAVSFDGTQVAFSAEPLPADGSSQIYVARFGEGEPEPVTSGQYENTSPSWAPDGSRLAFVSNRDGNTNIYVVDLGTRMATRVTSDPHPEYSPTWRP
jgi:TolB protein